ncbi:hypothetical protein A0128_15330 [Leptospira tipperaryensis]|uniref:Uncharacterized protein n=1 Tax=Leptospira tipperaryensis TaxID=2564040 RepID=A0A1D7UZT2_9LEPT|nr:OsmC family protein [Leptospira tipperaryensis]AOP35091.1 hypothetical protein A0128_15330 [Leptospira tipperaryensis]
MAKELFYSDAKWSGEGVKILLESRPRLSLDRGRARKSLGKRRSSQSGGVCFWTGFQEIRYSIEVESDSPRENQDRFLEHIQKICPVKDTLRGVAVLSLEGASAL